MCQSMHRKQRAVLRQPARAVSQCAHQVVNFFVTDASIMQHLQQGSNTCVGWAAHMSQAVPSYGCRADNTTSHSQPPAP